MPIYTGTTKASSSGGQNPAFDWNACCKVVRDAFRDGVRAWIQNAYLSGGEIHGPDCRLTPGTLRSDFTFDQTISSAVRQVPNLPSTSVGNEFAANLRMAWDRWSKSYESFWGCAFPMFAAFPGPMAPPTRPTPPRPLSIGHSSGQWELSSATLFGNISPRLQRIVDSQTPAAGDSAAMIQGVRGLTDWIDHSFRVWYASAYFKTERIAGQGPIPSFAPPYVPVGSVLGGTLTGWNVLGGPPFGL